jgi:TatD DNase family protein
MAMKFFDAHTHAQFAAFDADRDAVIERSRATGVGMVNVGTNKSTSEVAIALSEKHPDLCWATVGLHPTHTHEGAHHDSHEVAADTGVEVFDWDVFLALAKDSKVVAIGECGLDYFHVKDEESKKKQKEAFVKQIELAHEVKKPLMIHCRSAFPELIEILSMNRGLLNALPGIIHFFSGTADEAKKLLDMGFYFTFGGHIYAGLR